MFCFVFFTAFLTHANLCLLCHTLTQQCFPLSAELSPCSPAGSELRLHSQNTDRPPLHNRRGGLLALCVQVQNPWPGELRAVFGHWRHEPAARPRHTPTANQSRAPQPAPHTHFPLRLQEGAKPSPLSPGRRAQRKLPSSRDTWPLAITVVEENICVDMGMCEWHEKLSCVMLEVQKG